MQGWKARGCVAGVTNGILTVTGQSAAPFLGFGAGKMAGPAVVTLRAHSPSGGTGKVEWRPTPQADDKAKSVPFELAGGEWQEVSVKLPAEGALGIVRLHLPAQKEPVQIDWIAIQSGQEKRRTDF